MFLDGGEFLPSPVSILVILELALEEVHEAYFIPVVRFQSLLFWNWL